MVPDIGKIDSPERMSKAIRTLGIVPFFRNGIPGWSIEELTDPGCWFTSSEELGPWDWKIDVVREGDIAYGKFLGGKAAFATVGWYRHFMNWRRSLPRYRMALGEDFTARTASDRLMQMLSPAVLKAIRENGALEASEIRKICSAIYPATKKATADNVVSFLQMGTWSVIGDFRRVYRGANLEYSGWQRASNTTPDDLFGKKDSDAGAPFWAKMFEESTKDSLEVKEKPDESRELIKSHILSICGRQYGDLLDRII